ncbi:MAG: ribosomal protein S18-alanine N-acetyltransferase [Rhodobacteraceae bacterium]|nr:ribosomal protein S18-alanine N-acetyltransferase [Paracoccaceae bacterium]
MMDWWPKTKAVPFVVEEVQSSDFETLAEIHARSFEHGWDEIELERLTAQEGVFVLIIRQPNGAGKRLPVGFIMIRAVLDEAEILTIAVDPQVRGQGLAGKLLHQAMFRLYGDRCKELFLEVDASNDAAMKLYKSHGFRKVGERKGYYGSGDGDGTALVLRADLV